MLSVGELSRLTKELILGLTPTNTSQEAAVARREIAEDLAKMRADGIMPDLPSDFDDLPLLPPPPPVPSEEEMLESKKRLIRASLGASWGFALSMEREEKLEGELCGAVAARIAAGPPLLTTTQRDEFLAEIAGLERAGTLPPSSAQYLSKFARRRAMPPTKKRNKKKRTR